MQVWEYYAPNLGKILSDIRQKLNILEKMPSERSPEHEKVRVWYISPKVISPNGTFRLRPFRRRSFRRIFKRTAHVSKNAKHQCRAPVAPWIRVSLHKRKVWGSIPGLAPKYFFSFFSRVKWTTIFVFCNWQSDWAQTP